MKSVSLYLILAFEYVLSFVYCGFISSCEFPFPAELVMLFSMESPACLSAPALFPDVFNFTGTRRIDYSSVDLPDKHMIPFSLCRRNSILLSGMQCLVFLS